jgi:NADH-ubiquinone oxidoreductase chain 6
MQNIINLSSIILNILPFIVIISAILTITSRNPVNSVIGLISVFVNSAILIIILSMDFIGLSYLIIYVGAIAILFLFVIMMLNIKIVELSETKTFYSYNYPLILLLGIGYYLIIINQFNIDFSLSNISYWFDYINSIRVCTSTACHMDEITLLSTSGAEFNWDSLLMDIFHSNQVINIGYILYSYHAISLVIISAILLLAMVSPIILCFTSKNNSPP